MENKMFRFKKKIKMVKQIYQEILQFKIKKTKKKKLNALV